MYMLIHFYKYTGMVISKFVYSYGVIGIVAVPVLLIAIANS